MTMPAILGSLNMVNPSGTAPRWELRSGRVSSPVPVTSPDYQGYVDRCLRTWSVDVQLESGEYLIGCRVVSMQGNDREGVRRLPRLPAIGRDGSTIAGDAVVVGFLNGFAGAPTVLGALSPAVSSSSTADSQEAVQVTTRDPHEIQDRVEFVDISYPTRDLITSVMTRNNGYNVEHEHRGETLVDGEPRAAQRLERHFGGRSVELEHRVEVDADTTALIRESNQNALELRSIHAVNAPSGMSSVIVSDLEAKVLQLTQQVENLATLVLRSNQGSQLLLQQETDALRTTIYADSDTKTVGLLAEDRSASTRAGWSIGPRGELLLRRIDGSNRETKIELNDDNSLTIQTPTGPTVHLGTDEVLVTSGGSTVRVSEDDGISVLTSDGKSSIVATDDSLVVTGPTATIKAATVHLQTGAMLVGDSAAGAQRVPSAERLAQRMLTIETALRALSTWAQTHTHTSASPGVSTGPSLAPAPTAPTGLFNLNTDTLKSVKGV